MKRTAMSLRPMLLTLGLLFAALPAAMAQDESVRPGINKSYENLTGEDAIKRFESEGRDIFKHRKEIVAACELKPGTAVADVGAGSGLFTRLFAPEVGPQGKVYAVDITSQFVEHIARTCKEAGVKNVVGVVCTEKSTKLDAASVDVVFNCDTYHHFEYPVQTLASIHQALKPGGRLILIDFEKIEGVSPKWVIGHVRADKQTVTAEVTKAGFKLLDEVKLMDTQYMLRFEKVE